MNGRIYVELNMTLLHTEHTTFGSCGFRGEVFILIYFHYMADNVALVVWPVWTPEGRLAGLINILRGTRNLSSLIIILWVGTP